MDIAFHDEEFNRKHKQVLDNIRIDPVVTVEMDTAWVYAQVALDEYRRGDLESAKAAQKIAEQAYGRGLTLLPDNLNLITEDRLREISASPECNRSFIAVD
jgi:hypothetical protein